MINHDELKSEIVLLSESLYTGVIFKAPKFDPDFLIKVCKGLGVDRFTLRGKTRKREYVYIRYVCFDYMKRYTTYSLSRIGQIFGRDHATVYNGLQVDRNLTETKNQEYLEIKEKIKNILET